MANASRPPQLAGLTFVEPIGTGGFADVYLYQQALPSRRVAVKVLRESTGPEGMAQFHAEANVMAQLSSHPSIVPIYQADVSPDGRAYLVMEYCPPPHLAERFRAERIPVPEALEIGVKIASAVETAHRAGILHRDIKPHNILTNAYGAPLLTDFGIASAAGDGEAAGYGMSIPWSPREAFEDPAPFDVRSDVYSLAATVYSLLAGRSPFEVPGGANDNATLMHRIENQDPSLILRADVPEALNALLRTAMSRRLDDRPASAMALARAIQEIQIGLHLAPTRLEVMDASTAGPHESAAVVADARTQVKPISIIIPDAIVERGTLLRPRTITQADDRTGLHPSRRAPQPDTIHQRAARPVDLPRPSDPAGTTDPLADPLGDARRPLGSPEGETEQEATGPSARTLMIGVAALVLIAAVVVGAMVLGSDPEGDAPALPAPSSSPSLAVGGGPSAPEDVRVVRRAVGDVVVRWANPDPEPGDSYLAQAGGSLDALGAAQRLNEPRMVVTADADKVCVRVAVVRSGVPGPSYHDCVFVP